MRGMPIYDYACEECGNGFEHLARRMDEAAPACPKCGGKKTAKQLSAFAVGAASGSAASGKSLPMGGGGGCCPCGKGAGACSRGV
jgi:putative FmdB family regulatory protein